MTQQKIVHKQMENVQMLRLDTKHESKKFGSAQFYTHRS